MTRTWIAKWRDLVIFGLHMTGIYRIPFLNMIPPAGGADRNQGYLALLNRHILSAGWSPLSACPGCNLDFALNGAQFLGVSLLSAYSAGLAIPFLLAALGIGWVTTILRRYGKVMRYIEIAMGVLLIIVGVMLFSGTFALLSRYGFFVDLGL
jgi:cytochrome c-type biogenesis protein